LLNPDKEKFVKAWTDKVMHLGNTTSNRVYRNSTGFYNMECEKGFTETKIHKENGCSNPKI